MNPDGSAPSDNPFFYNANANAKKVFSLGHRNSYGFTFHRHTGHLWETENGPRTMMRSIVSSRAATTAGPPSERHCKQSEFPSTPSWPIAPAPLLPPASSAIPENSTVYPAAYRNNLLFVDFNGGRIRRVVLSGPDLTLLGSSSIAYNGGQGFLLSLMLGADGFVYVSNTSSIFKVVPQ